MKNQAIEDAIKYLETSLKQGIKPDKALKQLGIDDMISIFSFMSYLREIKRTKLLNKLK